MAYQTRATPGQTPNREVPKTVRNYLVTGTHEVFGHSRGEVVTLELTEAHAASLIESGHLALHTERAAPDNRED